MDALLMCGGRGSRLDAEVEKPLFEVGGRALVDRVLDALGASRIEATHAVVTPQAPETAAHVSANIPVVETAGDGYVADLQAALEEVEPPVLTVAADLPLLSGAAIDRVLDRFEGPSIQVCVPAALKRRLGLSADTTYSRGDREVAPTGVNVVADTDTETMFLTYDTRYAVNVNRLEDAELAEALL